MSGNRLNLQKIIALGDGRKMAINREPLDFSYLENIPEQYASSPELTAQFETGFDWYQYEKLFKIHGATTEEKQQEIINDYKLQKWFYTAEYLGKLFANSFIDSELKNQGLKNLLAFALESLEEGSNLSCYSLILQEQRLTQAFIQSFILCYEFRLGKDESFNKEFPHLVYATITLVFDVGDVVTKKVTEDQRIGDIVEIDLGSKKALVRWRNSGRKYWNQFKYLKKIYL